MQTIQDPLQNSNRNTYFALAADLTLVIEILANGSVANRGLSHRTPTNPAVECSLQVEPGQTSTQKWHTELPPACAMKGDAEQPNIHQGEVEKKNIHEIRNATQAPQIVSARAMNLYL